MTAYQDISPERIKYGVVLNDLADTTAPIDLAGWRLEHARSNEIDEFRPEIVRYAAAGLFGWPPPQESTITQVDDHGIQSTRQNTAAEWRYYVVRPVEPDAISGRALQQALRISEAELWVEAWSAKPRNQ